MIEQESLAKDQYFASQPAVQLVRELLYRVKQFDDYMQNCGRLEVWQQTYRHYYQGMYKGARINQVGSQGEYSELCVNHFRNILMNILNMTTEQRPSFDPRAINTDHDSQAQTIVAQGVLEYYNRVGKMENYSRKSCEQYEVYGDGYIEQGWDFDAGEDYTPDPADPAKKLKQGDIFHKNYAPFDVIFDFTAGLLDAPKSWYVLRGFKNKWDLIQKYPKLKDQIMSISSNEDTYKYMRVGARDKYSADFVPVFRFYHDRTPSMPNGRVVDFVGENCWLTDTTLPKFYKKMPVYRLSGDDQDGSGFGYTIAFDLAAVQECIDAIVSVIVTNIRAFGVQNIIAEADANIGVEELDGGLKVITHSSKLKEPHAMELLKIPAEVFNFLEMLIKTMETISGVNSVARGNPEASLKSGAALALVQAMAIQFISGLQKSYAMLLEDLGTGIIDILKECATTPRMIEIAGKNNRSYIEKFTKDDISKISRVMVDVGNPLSRTTAGKVAIADQLMGANMIESPQQYLQVLTTGKLEPLIEGKQAEIMLIRSENEAMSDGEAVSAIVTDNHLLHISEHKVVLSSPESRKDPKVIDSTLAHIQQHLNLWRTTDPSMLAALGQQPPPMIAAPTDEGATDPAAGNAPPQPVNPTVEKAAEVNMPSLPNNPLTGQEAQVAGGV